MKFLADESCAGPVIRALRDTGHDVRAIAEVAEGAADEVVERVPGWKGYQVPFFPKEKGGRIPSWAGPGQGTLNLFSPYSNFISSCLAR